MNDNDMETQYCIEVHCEPVNPENVAVLSERGRIWPNMAMGLEKSGCISLPEWRAARWVGRQMSQKNI